MPITSRILAAITALCLSATSLAAEPVRVERSTMLLLGNKAGFQEARYAADGSVTVHFEYNDRGRGPKLDGEYRVGANGIPDRLGISGVAYFKSPVEERFARDADGVRWKNASEDEQRAASTPGFYLALESLPEDTVLLARALLATKERRIALLPTGEARIEHVDTMSVRGGAGTARAGLYALHGLDLSPSYLWLDEEQRFLASAGDWSSTIRDGYEAALPALAARQKSVERAYTEARARKLTHDLRGALAIDDVRVFDPATLEVRAGQKIVIAAGRIVAVGPRDEIATPEDAEVWAGENRFAMPGLWDMHVHLSGNNDGLLHLAGGVTTVRDLANDNEKLSARIAEIEQGRDLGPRVIRAGFVDGRGPYAGPTKVFADDEREARAAVELFAEQGFEQVKLYSSLKPALVPGIIAHAHERGMRVSGHVPQGMSAREFVEAGADELQHANFLFLNFLAGPGVDTRTPQRFTTVAERGVELDLGGAEMRDFVELLRAKGTVVDPTLVAFEDMFLDRPGRMGPGRYRTVDRMPPLWQRFIRASTGGLAVTPATDITHRESYRRMVDLVGMLHRSGVTIVAGTDAFAGFSLARELELYVQAGIPPAEVLRIATLGAARVMKREREYGRLAPGFVADIALVDGDPTVLISDVLNVRRVVRGDRWFEAAALHEAVGIKP
ncbi:MAG TPA: amidohydrolase family protein [Candidatus Saccharimonadia bacterium]|nr:amidohydrolase family protein [Candidatus Saccharimonadia bacterium]